MKKGEQVRRQEGFLVELGVQNSVVIIHCAHNQSEKGYRWDEALIRELFGQSVITLSPSVTQ